MEIKRRDELTLDDIGNIEAPDFACYAVRDSFSGRGYGSSINAFEDYCYKFKSGSLFVVYSGLDNPSFPLFTWKKDPDDPQKGQWVSCPSIVENYDAWLKDILLSIHWRTPNSMKKAVAVQHDIPDQYDDVPDISIINQPSTPRAEKTTFEKVEDWSREAGKTNTKILDSMLNDAKEDIEEIKEHYHKSDYLQATTAAGAAIVEQLTPLGKVKAIKKGMEIGEKLDDVQDVLDGDLPSGSKGKGKKKNNSGNGNNGNNKDDDGEDPIKCRGQQPKGNCGEQLIEKHYGKDFEPLDTNSLKNDSGNGIDHAFKDRKSGELVFVESKSTATDNSRMPLSKLQKKGGEKYTKDRIKAMEDGYYGGKGPWASKKGDEDFFDKIEALKEEMMGTSSLSYAVCRIQLEPDPTGCYGQRVSPQGKLSSTGKKSGKCRQKIGTTINCKEWS